MEDRFKEFYLANPDNLLLKEPFFRGGDTSNIFIGNTSAKVSPREMQIDDIRSKVKYNVISQDLYECEYYPSLHKIFSNMSFPRISVKLSDGNLHSISQDDMILALPIQKNIHNLHTLHLAVNRIEHTLLESEPSEEVTKSFSEAKQAFIENGLEKYKAMCISRQKRCGDVGLLYKYNREDNEVDHVVFSHAEGKHIIENKDEYGKIISRSLHYLDGDNKEYIDTWTKTSFYRHVRSKTTNNNGNNWELIKNNVPHGFKTIPLLYKRGYVAWEFAQSPIEMYEFIYNIYCAVVRKFGTFALFITGDFNWETDVSGDETVLVFNQKNPDGNGKIQTIEYPKAEGIVELLEKLRGEIEQAGSVTFMSPDRVKSGGDAASSMAVMLTMKNDLALAKQSIEDWSDFTDSMWRLHCEGMDLVNDTTKYSALRVQSRLSVWTPESTSSLINNLNLLKAMGAISDQTLMEIAPYVAPDEKRRKQTELKEASELVNETTSTETIVVDNNTNNNNNLNPE